MAENTFFGTAAYPWQHFKSPLRQWRENPSFLVGELTFYIITVAALVHATRTSRQNVALFVASLLAGTANDVFFMALPIVNNFWQSQAVIMLSSRLPLYIPCVYICFMYIPTVAARHLANTRRAFAAQPSSSPGGAFFSERRLFLSCASGLASMCFYSPYDLMGGKFIWWTWHDTDAPIRARWLDNVAPMSSTLWTLTFTAAFAWLTDLTLPSDDVVVVVAGDGEKRRHSFSASPPRQEAAAQIATVVGDVARMWPVFALSTPVMMVIMGLTQPLEPLRAHGAIALTTTIVVLAALAIRGLLISDRRVNAAATRVAATSKLLLAVVAFYAAMLTIAAASFDPSNVVSTGVHQLTGPCGIEKVDISGTTRHEFLCVDPKSKHFVSEPYDFHCCDEERTAPAPTGAEWYTVCGRPHDDSAGSSYPQFVFAVAVRGVITTLLTWMCMFC